MDLTETRLESIFTDRIARVLLSGASRQVAPSVVFVVGQPGSGKSQVQRQARAAFRLQDSVIIDVDDLRGFHPKWREYQRADDRTSAFNTHPAAKWWVRRADEYACREQYNVIVSATLRSTDSGLARVARYRGAGYSTKVILVSVPAVVSWLCVLERYHAQRKVCGWGRYVERERHDDSVLAVRELSRMIDEQDSRADAVSGVYVWTKRQGIADCRVSHRRRAIPLVSARVREGQEDLVSHRDSFLASASLKDLVEEMDRLGEIVTSDRKVIAELLEWFGPCMSRAYSGDHSRARVIESTRRTHE
jgi:hypothetical protein